MFKRRRLGVGVRTARPPSARPSPQVPAMIDPRPPLRHEWPSRSTALATLWLHAPTAEAADPPPPPAHGERRPHRVRLRQQHLGHRPGGRDAAPAHELPGRHVASPSFSPDGRWVAFSGEYGGNTDVYVVPVGGGEPGGSPGTRAPTSCRDGRPDGARIVFSSAARRSRTRPKLLDRGARAATCPTALPMPRAYQGKYSPDGKRCRLPHDQLMGRRVAQLSRRPEPRRSGSSTSPRHEMRVAAVDRLQGHRSRVGGRRGLLHLRPRLVHQRLVVRHAHEAARRRSRASPTSTSSRSTPAAGMVVFEQAGYLHTLDPRHGAAPPARHHGRAATSRGWCRSGRTSPARVTQPARSRPRASARSSRRAATSSRSPPRRATGATSRARPARPSARRPGRPTARRWRTSATPAASTSSCIEAAGRPHARRARSRSRSRSFYYTPAWSPDGTLASSTPTRTCSLWVLDVASRHVDAASTPIRTCCPSGR